MQKTNVEQKKHIWTKIGSLICAVIFLVCFVLPLLLFSPIGEFEGVDVINGGLYDKQSDITKIINDDASITYSTPKYDKMTNEAKEFFNCFVESCDGEGRSAAVLLLIAALCVGGLALLALLSIVLKSNFAIVELILATISAALCVVAIVLLLSLKKYTLNSYNVTFGLGFGMYIMLVACLGANCFSLTDMMLNKLQKGDLC